MEIPPQDIAQGSGDVVELSAGNGAPRKEIEDQISIKEHLVPEEIRDSEVEHQEDDDDVIANGP